MKRIEIKLTKEQGKVFREKMEKHRRDAKERMDKLFSEIDPNVTAMLRLANKMTKEELLSLHPEHAEIINKIVWN